MCIFLWVLGSAIYTHFFYLFYLIFLKDGSDFVFHFFHSLHQVPHAPLLSSAFPHLPTPHILLRQSTTLVLFFFFLTRNTHWSEAAEVILLLASQVRQDHLHFWGGHFFSLGGIWPCSFSQKRNHPRCSPPLPFLFFFQPLPRLLPNTHLGIIHLATNLAQCWEKTDLYFYLMYFKYKKKIQNKQKPQLIFRICCRSQILIFLFFFFNWNVQFWKCLYYPAISLHWCCGLNTICGLHFSHNHLHCELSSEK